MILTDTPTRNGLPDYSTWANLLSSMLGTAFCFEGTLWHPKGVILTYSYENLFFHESLFGQTLNVVVSVTEDKTAGIITEAYIQPVQGTIDATKISVSLSQCSDTISIFKQIILYIRDLIGYFISTFLEGLCSNTSTYRYLRCTSNPEYYEVTISKIESSLPENLNSLISTCVENDPITLIYSSLALFRLKVDEPSVVYKIDKTGVLNLITFKIYVPESLKFQY